MGGRKMQHTSCPHMSTGLYIEKVPVEADWNIQEWSHNFLRTKEPSTILAPKGLEAGSI